MSTSRGSNNLPSAGVHGSMKLRALLHRCREAYRGVRMTLADVRSRRLSADPPRRIDAPESISADSSARRREVVSLLVVHKKERPGYPRVDLNLAAGPADGEAALELRRLIAWSGGTIADVARVLKTRTVDLDNTARRLLQDEIETLEIDLASLKGQLLDPVDWNSEFGYLLAGEVAPFDDFAADNDDSDE